MEPVDVLRAALEAVEGAGVPADLRALAFTTAVDLVVTGRAHQAPSARTAPAPHPGLAAVPPLPVPGAPASVPRGVGRGEPTAGDGTGITGRSASSALTVSSGAARTSAALREAPGGDRGEPGSGRRSGGAAAGDVDLDGIAEALDVPVERLDRLYDAHHGTLELCGDPGRFGRTRAERVGNAVLLLLAALRWSGGDSQASVSDVVVRAEVSRLGLLDVGNYSKHLAARRGLWATTGSGRGASYRLRYDGLEEARRLARTLLDDPAL